MEEKEEYNEEIYFIEYLNVLKKNYKLIGVLVISAVLATGIISSLSPSIYEATAAIMPANQSNDQRGMSSLAAQFGIAAPASSNTQELVNLLKSNILMDKAIKRNNLLPVFFKKEELAEMPEAGKIWNGIRTLKSIFHVNHNVQKGIIELSAEYTVPKTAADIINYMLTELTDYMSSEAKRVAETNREYLESLIDRNADPLIRQKIYSMIARQIEISMMAEVKENFAFKVLDPPKTPDRRVRPKIKKNIVFAFAISLFAGIIIAFIKEYFESIRQRGLTGRHNRQQESTDQQMR